MGEGGQGRGRPALASTEGREEIERGGCYFTSKGHRGITSVWVPGVKYFSFLIQQLSSFLVKGREGSRKGESSWEYHLQSEGVNLLGP